MAMTPMDAYLTDLSSFMERTMPPLLSTPPLDLSPAHLPTRDDIGHVIHPGLDGLEEDVGVEPQLRARGFDVALQLMDDERRQRFVDQDSPDLTWWTPSEPAGDHWSLVLIAESEADGPIAVYARPYRLSPSPPLVIWSVFDRPLDFPHGVIARAFHGEAATSIRVRGISLEEIKTHLPRDLTYVPRQQCDPPYLVCTGIGSCTADQSVCG
jgi:hypothetical protein